MDDWNKNFWRWIQDRDYGNTDHNLFDPRTHFVIRVPSKQMLMGYMLEYLTKELRVVFEDNDWIYLDHNYKSLNGQIVPRVVPGGFGPFDLDKVVEAIHKEKI